MMREILIAMGISLITCSAQSAEPPAAVRAHLLPGHQVLGVARAAVGPRVFHLVALGRPDDAGTARPLLIFEEQPDGAVAQVGRNDRVVLRSDEGGQCDPFLDGGGVIAVKGPYFTVQNAVACGSHWTWYVTFRFDGKQGAYVFDNERSQSCSLNRSTAPNAEALAADGRPVIRRADPARPVAFTDWRPTR